MMYATWSPANLAWIVFFGDAFCSIRGENFFPDKSTLVRTLQSAGLDLGNKVSKNRYSIVEFNSN